MPTRPARLLRPFLLVAAMLPLLGAGPQSPAPAPAKVEVSAPEQAAAALPPQVRLRKLHLVRPDLIPYPLRHEVIV